jgi:hypothetical protein
MCNFRHNLQFVEGSHYFGEVEPSIDSLVKYGNTYFINISGIHYKQIPNFDTLPGRFKELIVRSIAINSGYTSRIQVCINK